MSIAEKARNERMAVYLDCILGIIFASIGLIGIIFFTVPAWNSPGYLIGLSFWIFWLILCVFFISLGISIHYANKNFDSNTPQRKDLKAPRVG